LGEKEARIVKKVWWLGERERN